MLRHTLSYSDLTVCPIPSGSQTCVRRGEVARCSRSTWCSVLPLYRLAFAGEGPSFVVQEQLLLALGLWHLVDFQILEEVDAALAGRS